MIKHISLITIILLGVILISCQPNPKNWSEYRALDGSVVSQELNPMTYQMTFLPHRFNNRSEKAEDNILNFKLRIQDGSQKSILLSGTAEEQSQKLSYYSEYIREHISMIMDKDTIPCGMVVCERNYNMYPYTNLLLSFDIGDRTKVSKARIVLNDHYANTGKLYFSFKKNILRLNTHS